MNDDFRRLITAMLVAMAVFLAYRYLIEQIYPTQPPPPAAADPPTDGTPQPATTPSQQTQTSTSPSQQPATTTSAPGTPYILTAGSSVEPIELGGRENDAIKVELRPRGAAVASIRLTARDKKGKLQYRTAPDEDEPYQLLGPVDDGVYEHLSFNTHRLWVKDGESRSWDLDDLVWTVAEESAQHAVFSTTLRAADDSGDLLRVTKSYRLWDGKPVFDLDVTIENVSGRELSVSLEQDGPIGIPAEHQQYDMRRVLAAQFVEGQVKLAKAQQHGALQTAARNEEPIGLLTSEGPLLWTALTNKYFGVFARPMPIAGGELQNWVQNVVGTVAVPGAAENPGDLLARTVTASHDLPPGETVAYPFEIYAGPKDAESAGAANAVYADKTKLYYQVSMTADTYCCCTFLWLQEFMTWLLSMIVVVVRNYGVAIIILVCIIRTLLHPLTVFQQKSMFRMQESMARIQPKMNVIKEKFANDKVKQNQEMMRLWSEEGVNPAANMVSFLPLMLQMPILVALWTALNTDPHLRHEPFLMLPHWIRDLSAPDALYTFPNPIHIPLLSWMMGPINSINVLPLLMGVSMWLQQKYMPKPHMKAKLEAAKEQRAQGKKPAGMTPEEQMRQQQMMMYMMSIIFPLMFYKMPAGLNLYWMATNVFGIFESIIIRRQLEREKEKRKAAGPPPPKKPGMIGRWLKRMAAQAEELQKKADELSERGGTPKKKKKKDDDRR